MLIDGIQLAEGSSIDNVSIASGSTFPIAASTGELFYHTTNQLLYSYSGSAWKQSGGSLTIGSTSLELGNQTLTLAGLTSVTATTFNGALNGTASNSSSLNGVAAASYVLSSALATVATSGSYNDLTNKPAATAEVTPFYDIVSGITGKPSAGATVLRMYVVRNLYFPVGLAASYASTVTPGTGYVTLSVRKNGTQFATIVFGGPGNTVATLNCATQTSFLAGDTLTIVAPAVQDATFANCSYSLVAYTT